MLSTSCPHIFTSYPRPINKKVTVINKKFLEHHLAGCYDFYVRMLEVAIHGLTAVDCNGILVKVLAFLFFVAAAHMPGNQKNIWLEAAKWNVIL